MAVFLMNLDGFRALPCFLNRFAFGFFVILRYGKHEFTGRKER